MQKQTSSMNSVVTVKTHDKLRKVSQEEFASQAPTVLTDADRGNQTTVRAADGTVTAVIGLNGHRFFPDPNPDPLDEILQIALDSEKITQK